MKKKEIHHNAIVSFKTNNKTNFSISYLHYDKGDRGYPSGMHLSDKIKPRELNYIHIEGKCNGIGAGGPLGKNTDMFYDDDGYYKLFNYNVSLYTIENFKRDIVGELSIEDEEELEDFETGKPFTRPAGIRIELIINKRLYDLIEKKVLDKSKILNSITLNFGAFYESNSRQKNLGKSVKTKSEYVYQVFSIPITHYQFTFN